MPKPSAFEPAMRRALTGRDAQILERCGSTNDVARDWARADAPHLSIVVADAQDTGRGRQGRTWLADPGDALLASIIVRPSLEPSRWGLLPLLTGVAASVAIEQRTGVHVGLKWPNDLLIDARKLGGILCEGDPGAWAVLGIGINVSSSPASEPEATSLAAAGALRLDRADLAASLLSAVDAVLRSPEAAMVRYEERSVTLGMRVRASTLDGDSVTGTAIGLDPDGALQIETDAGTVRVHAGDVEHLRAEG